MSFSRDNLLKVKQDCIIHFNLLLFATKIFLTVSICWTLRGPRFQGFWLWLVWIGLSLAIDGLLIFKKPSFFTNVVLSEAEQKKYELNSEEFKQYLCFSPKARFARTLFVTFLVFVFCPIPSWEESLPVGLIVGFLFIDPLIRRFFNAKTPKFYTPANSDPIPSSLEFHKNNISFVGSAAWTAYHSTKLYDNRSPKI